jgi:tetratricopeptide (TPR) repeat protein
LRSGPNQPGGLEGGGGVNRFFKVGVLGFFLIPVCWADSIDDTAVNHYQSGLAYERLGRLEDAYTELQLACVLDTNDATKSLALGLVAVRLGRYDVAQRALEHSITIDANSIASYFVLALLYEKQSVWDRALDCWNRFLPLNQDDELKLIAQKHVQYLEIHRAAPAA